MNGVKRAIVTGAFSYLGKYITRELMQKGVKVKTLTGHPDRENEFGGRVETAPFHFAEPARMAAELAAADWLFNTYWVRFNRGIVTYGGAVANTQNLIAAALEQRQEDD
jgi:NAD(P)-dependent dehydrogenase (short-subunit alcohol dehydrogenase family)